MLITDDTNYHLSSVSIHACWGKRWGGAIVAFMGKFCCEPIALKSSFGRKTCDDCYNEILYHCSVSFYSVNNSRLPSFVPCAFHRSYFPSSHYGNR